jgi:hypothetical protein
MSEVIHVVTTVYRWATAHCGVMSEVIHVVTSLKLERETK